MLRTAATRQPCPLTLLAAPPTPTMGVSRVLLGGGGNEGPGLL